MKDLIVLGILYFVPTVLIVIARIIGHFDKKANAKSVELAVEKIMDEKCRGCRYSESLLRREFAEKDAALAEREEKLSRNFRAKLERQLLNEFSASDLHVFLPDIYPGRNPRLWPKEMRDRLLRSVRDGISIKKINFIEAEIIGSEGDVYTTTLEKCSCKDHNKRLANHPYLPKDPTPCKHMLYLYLHLGHASYTGADVRRYTKQYQEAVDAAAPKKRNP